MPGDRSLTEAMKQLSKQDREKPVLEAWKNGVERPDSLTESERNEIILSLANLARDEFGLAQAAGTILAGDMPESELSMLEKLDFMLEWGLAEAKDPNSVGNEQSEADWKTAQANMSPAAYLEALMFALRAAQLYPETRTKLREDLLRNFEEKALDGDRAAILAIKGYAAAFHDTELTSRIINVAAPEPRNPEEEARSLERLSELIGMPTHSIRALAPPQTYTVPVWKYVKP